MNAISTENKSFTKVYWGAIFAGIIIALSIESLLNLLALGLGLTAFKSEINTMKNIGMGAIIWIFISGPLAMLAGGWIAGRLATVKSAIDGALHGLVAWGVTILLIFMLITTTTGSLISTTSNVFGQIISSSAKAVSSSSMNGASKISDIAKNMFQDFPTSASEQIKDTAHDFLVSHYKQQNSEGETSKKDLPKSQERNLSNALTSLLEGKTEDAKNQARQKAVDVLTQNSDLTRTEARQAVSDWEKEYAELKAEANEKMQQAKETTKETAERTSRILASMMLVTFLSFLLGAFTASLGGFLGVHYRLKKSNEKASKNKPQTTTY